MNITYYGHSCLGIEINDISIIVDPFITGNPKATHIDIHTLKANYILLTHAHYDHIIDLEALVKQTNASIIANHEIVTYYAQKDIKGHAMNPGGSWDFEFGRIKMVRAVHSSSFPDGTYGGDAVGFIIEAAGKTVYIAGDTALTMDMKFIPLFFQLDLAVFPIGGNFTMDVEEALVASDLVECNKILGVHYDTVDLIEIDHEAAKRQFTDKGKELILMDIGENQAVMKIE